MEIRKAYGPYSAVAGLHDNIGNIKKAKGDFKGALKEYQTALEIRKKLGSKRWLASSYGNIGLLFVKMKKNHDALPYLRHAIEIADSNAFVEIALTCREGLSIAYRNLGNYKKAYETYVQYSEQNDSVHRVELEEKLNYYKQLFEAEKKDRLIQKLEEEQKLADLNNEKQKILVEKQTLISNSLIVFSSLLLMVIFFIYRYFKMKRKADEEMHLRKEQINKQKTLDLMKELEVSTIKSFMEGQEKERARIAGDLHDRLGSLLSTVKLHFNSLEPILTKDPEAAKNYRYAIELLDKSVEEVRAVSRNLTKGVLTQFGLLAAVENMRDAINSARKVKMTVINSGMETRLKSETEITLFRVIQELVTNVIRHAQTDEIFVQFVGADDRLNIIVEDHGIGFDKDNIKSEGIGLNNLKERVESIGGEFTIDSIPGEGTTIIIDIPYETAA
jgi:signal transduction histidine kinase